VRTHREFALTRSGNAEDLKNGTCDLSTIVLAVNWVSARFPRGAASGSLTLQHSTQMWERDPRRKQRKWAPQTTRNTPKVKPLVTLQK